MQKDTFKLTLPDWCGCYTYPNAYIFADKTVEEKGDFKQIAAVYFSPLSIKIFATGAKYQDVIKEAQRQHDHIKANIDTPLVISATGQTVRAKLPPQDKRIF